MHEGIDHLQQPDFVRNQERTERHLAQAVAKLVERVRTSNTIDHTVAALLPTMVKKVGGDCTQEVLVERVVAAILPDLSPALAEQLRQSHAAWLAERAEETPGERGDHETAGVDAESFDAYEILRTWYAQNPEGPWWLLQEDTAEGDALSRQVFGTEVPLDERTALLERMWSEVT